MPWNGSGGFVRRALAIRGGNVWGQVAAAGRAIRTDDHDSHDGDLANGLENCITREGQNSPTANLPMNSRRHVNVADAVADNDYAAWGQTRTHVSEADDTLETTLRNDFAPSLGTLSDGASIAWNLANDPVAQVTLGGNRTLANPTGASEGAAYILSVIQDSTGGRTLTFGNNYDFGSEGAPALSATGGEIDILAFLYVAGKMRLVGAATGFD